MIDSEYDNYRQHWIFGITNLLEICLVRSERKRLFFRPLSGHGGKAVYRGDKITKSIWAEIVKGGYIALVIPSERSVEIGEAPESRKMDVRLYTYDGKSLIAAARLYQGQTTNFRTPDGGFAPVFIV